MSGADIARLCNEAALITARGVHAEEGIQVADFDSALERVLAGKKFLTFLSPVANPLHGNSPQAEIATAVF